MMKYAKQTLRYRVAVACLIVALMVSGMAAPAEAAADSDNTFTFSSGGVAVSGSGTGYEIDGTDLTITASGIYTITGSGTEGTVTVKKELAGVTLILNGLTLSSSETSPITINKSSQVTIQVAGVNVITDDENIDEESTNVNFEGAGIKVKSGGSLELTGSGTLTVNGNCKNGIKGGAEASIMVDGPTLNISAANDALSSDDSVTVKSGTLNLTAEGDGIQASPDADDTASAGTVIINGGTFNIEAQGDGIQGEGGVSVIAGTFDIQTGGGYKATLGEEDSAKGIKSAANVNLTGGTYIIDSADDTIHANGNVTVEGGTYTISTGDDALHADYVLNVGVKGGSGPSITITASVEGFEGAVVNLYSGNGSIIASDDGINAANSDLENSYAFAINCYDGTWKINAMGDAIDSNKDINMYGGLIEAFGAQNSGNSALDYDGSAAYEGGTVLAVGMSGMAQGFSSGTYVSFGSMSMMGGGPGGQGGTPPQMNGGNIPAPPEGTENANGQRPTGQQPGGQRPEGQQGQGGPQNSGSSSTFTISAGSSIVIKDSAGNVLYTATGLRTADSVIFADDSLVSGQTYALYIDGTQVATATAVTGTGSMNQGGGPAGSGFPFLDVANTRWYYDAVRTVYQKEIMKGTSNTAFSPEESMTRGMLAQILYNLAGSPKTEKDAGFADVGADAWYANAVNWAVEAGIISGYGSGRFGPDDAVTREQMSALLYRYAEHKGYDTSKTTNLNGYGDGGSVSEYARTAMNWANAMGLITGTDKQLLLPLGNTTRAQAASILMRFVNAF